MAAPHTPPRPPRFLPLPSQEELEAEAAREDSYFETLKAWRNSGLFDGFLAGLAVGSLGIALLAELYSPPPRHYNLLATDWQSTPPDVYVLDSQLTGEDCISYLEQTQRLAYRAEVKAIGAAPGDHTITYSCERDAGDAGDTEQ